MTIGARTTVVLLLLAAAAQGAGAGDGPEEGHGIFTGQIKPVVYVKDVEVSAPFYRDVLGFDFLGFAGPDGAPYYAEMAAAGVKFGLHEPTSEGQEAKIGQQRLYFRVRDLGAHRARVESRGGKPGAIKTTDWMDMFIVRDMDGNEIVFAVTDPARHGTDPWSAEEKPQR